MKGFGECQDSSSIDVTYEASGCWEISIWSLKSIPFCVTGSDKEAILDLITSRSNAQRQEIRAAYKSQYGKVLEHLWQAFSKCIKDF